MDPTGSAAEADPLKRGEDGVETGTAPSATELKKKKSCNEGLGFSKLTHWRTAVFFFSLFLCLTIVFAFSFIIPCPVRPQYLISWNMTFPEASAYNHVLSIALLHLLRCKSPVSSPSLHRLLICRFPSQFPLSPLPPAVTYDFIAIEDASKDKVMDVLVVVRNNEGSKNNTCSGEGMRCLSVFNFLRDRELNCFILYVCLIQRYCVFFPGLPSPCVFVLAVDGTDGVSLWERPLKPEFHWAQCGLDKDASRSWDCLVSHSDLLSAVDKYTG